MCIRDSLGVDHRHVPGAGLMAHAAADARLGVHHAGAGFRIGSDGMHGAVLHAPGVFALLAMLDGELARAEDAVAAFAAGTEVVVLPHAHAGGILTCTTVVAQRAHQLAALAARAAGAVGHDEFLRHGVEHDAARRDAVFDDAPLGKSTAGDQARQTDAHAADDDLTTSEAPLRCLAFGSGRFCGGLDLIQGPLLLLHRMFPFLMSFTAKDTYPLKRTSHSRS